MAKGQEWATRIREEVQKSIIGQDEVIERLLVALLANGHVLLEGLPGLAKTLLIKSLGAAMGLEFERIQFTPDLLPSDVVGTMVFQPKEGTFRVHQGPVFANLVLADEINRAPAKVQSALLEAMQERQVTIGGQTHLLPKPFWSWRRRIRLSKKEPTRYLKPRRTVFFLSFWWTIPPSMRREK